MKRRTMIGSVLGAGALAGTGIGLEAVDPTLTPADTFASSYSGTITVTTTFGPPDFVYPPNGGKAGWRQVGDSLVISWTDSATKQVHQKVYSGDAWEQFELVTLAPAPAPTTTSTTTTTTAP